MLGHHRHASEAPFKWRFAGGPMMTHFLDPPSHHKKKTVKKNYNFFFIKKPLLILDPLWQHFLDPYVSLTCTWSQTPKAGVLSSRPDWRLTLNICMLGNLSCFTVCWFFFKIIFFENFFQEYHQSVKQFGSRSGPTSCRAWSGSKLFAKVINRRH